MRNYGSQLLSAWRAVLGLSQEGFGSPFAATKQNVGRWEAGTQRPIDATKIKMDEARVIPARAWFEPVLGNECVVCMECDLPLNEDCVRQCNVRRCPKQLFIEQSREQRNEALMHHERSAAA
jgi:hypothetical protein